MNRRDCIYTFKDHKCQNLDNAIVLQVKICMETGGRRSKSLRRHMIKLEQLEMVQVFYISKEGKRKK